MTEPKTSNFFRHYRFLEDLQEAFTKKFKKRVILKANAYAMEKKFSSKIGELVHHFNTHPDIADIDRSAVVAAMDKAEKVKTVMGENIRRSLNAQEHTNKLRRQSELIRQVSIFIIVSMLKLLENMLQRLTFLLNRILSCSRRKRRKLKAL